MFFRSFLIFIVMIIPQLIYSEIQSVNLTSSDFKSMPISKQIYYYIDASNLTLEQIRNLPDNQFSPYTNKLSGRKFISGHSLWFKMDIINKIEDKKNFILQVEKKSIPELVMYYADSTNTTVLGINHPFSLRELKILYPSYPLSLEYNKKETVYLKYPMVKYQEFQFKLWKVNAFNNNSIFEGIFYGFFYAVIISFFFYNLVLWIFLKENAFLFYVLYIFTYCCTQIADNGLNYMFFQTDIFHPVSILLKISNGLSIIAVYLFTQSFLETKKRLPVLHKVMYILMVLSIPNCFSGYEISKFVTFFKMYMIMSMFVAALAIFIISIIWISI